MNKVRTRLLLAALAVVLTGCGNAPTLPSQAEIEAVEQSAPAMTSAPTRNARYLGNAGVMVTDGITKVLFDPLFDENYRQYQLVPDDIRAAMLAGTAPFDGVDVLFISHAHGDHFSAAPVLAYLQAHPQVKLVAPVQAVEKLTTAGMTDTSNVIAIDQTQKDNSLTLQAGSLTVEAITIPHSGGARFAHIRNTVYRVHVADDLRVLHLGDATTETAPIAGQQKFWDATENNLVFTPYWLFKNDQRRAALDLHIRPKRAIGVHVPTDLATLKERYGTALDEVDLFTQPGEVRELAVVE